MLKCPICAEKLELEERSLFCAKGHRFDRAKSGYVNLLLSQKASQHGDEEAMLKARRDFLRGGHYDPLLNRLLAIISAYSLTSMVDLGCGEGYYTQKIAASCPFALMGIDISKKAVDMAQRQDKKSLYLVASTYRLPLLDQSCDGALSVFAPYSSSEVSRVLKTAGVFIEVSAGMSHLFELKELLYDDLMIREEKGAELIDSECILQERLSYSIHLHQEESANLFKMTPFYHRTPFANKKRLENVLAMDVTVDFNIRVFRKR